MRDVVISYFENYKKSIITLNELESLFTGNTTYEDFSLCIKKLIDEGILEEVNAKINTVKAIPLASKQLLQIVMKQNSIKVKCIKVTND